jgi:hypothetical protein
VATEKYVTEVGQDFQVTPSFSSVKALDADARAAMHDFQKLREREHGTANRRKKRKRKSDIGLCTMDGKGSA